MEFPHLSGAEVRKIMYRLLPAFALLASACSVALPEQTTTTQSVDIDGVRYTLVTDTKTGKIVMKTARLDTNDKRPIDVGKLIIAYVKITGQDINDPPGCAKAVVLNANNKQNLKTPTPDKANPTKPQYESDSQTGDGAYPMEFPPVKACAAKPTATATNTATQTPTRTSTPTPTRLVSPTLAAKVLSQEPPRLNTTVSATWPTKKTETPVPATNPEQEDFSTEYLIFGFIVIVAVASVTIGYIVVSARDTPEERMRKPQRDRGTITARLAPPDEKPPHLESGYVTNVAATMPVRERTITSNSEASLVVIAKVERLNRGANIQTIETDLRAVVGAELKTLQQKGVVVDPNKAIEFETVGVPRLIRTAWATLSKRSSSLVLHISRRTDGKEEVTAIQMDY